MFHPQLLLVQSFIAESFLGPNIASADHVMCVPYSKDIQSKSPATSASVHMGETKAYQGRVLCGVTSCESARTRR